jgi:hypothetical protein
MSYEGYTQILCKNGHYTVRDAYDDWGDDEQGKICSQCGEPFVWKNNVDLTNGIICTAWDEELGKCVDESYCVQEQRNKCVELQGRIDGYVELEIDKEAEYETYKCCGNSKIVKERTFKIPENKGHRINS